MQRSFGSEFEQGFVGALEALGPIVADFLKREETLMAREPMRLVKVKGGVKARAMDELD